MRPQDSHSSSSSMIRYQTDDEGVVSQPEYTLTKPSNGPNDRDHLTRTDKVQRVGHEPQTVGDRCPVGGHVVVAVGALARSRARRRLTDASIGLGNAGSNRGRSAAKTIMSGRRATHFRSAIAATRLRFQRFRTASAPRQHVHGEGVESRVPLTRVTTHLSNARIPVPRGDRDESRSALYERLMSFGPVWSEQEHRAEVLHNLQATHSAAELSGSSFGNALFDPLGGKVVPRLVVTRVLAQDAVTELRTILSASGRTPVSLVVHDDVVPTELRGRSCQSPPDSTQDRDSHRPLLWPRLTLVQITPSRSQISSIRSRVTYTYAGLSER